MMKITNPTFNYGEIGLQRSQYNLDKASDKVARASTELASQADPSADQVAHQQAPSERLYGSPIQDGLIEAKTSELEAQANSKTIEASDNNLGTTINTRA